MPDDELRTFTIEQIVKKFDVSKRSLFRYIKRGDLKAVRVGRKFRITAANLKEFLRGKE